MPSAWAKLALITLLVLSLGLKTWRSNAADQPHQQAAGTILVDTLAGEGFALSPGEGLEGTSWVGSRDACHIEITAVSPLGWHQSAIDARARGQSLAYVYSGSIYREQPVLLTKLDHYWHRLVNYFHSSQQPPVFAVVSSAACAGPSIERLALHLQ